MKLLITTSMHANPPRIGKILIINAKFENIVRRSDLARLGNASNTMPVNAGINATVKDNLEPTLADIGVFVVSSALHGSMRLIRIRKTQTSIVIR